MLFVGGFYSFSIGFYSYELKNIRIAKKLYEYGVEGRARRIRGRTNRVWIDGVRKVLNDRGLTLEEAKMNVYDRVEWRVCE